MPEVRYLRLLRYLRFSGTCATKCWCPCRPTKQRPSAPNTGSHAPRRSRYGAKVRGSMNRTPSSGTSRASDASPYETTRWATGADTSHFSPVTLGTVRTTSRLALMNEAAPPKTFGALSRGKEAGKRNRPPTQPSRVDPGAAGIGGTLNGLAYAFKMAFCCTSTVMHKLLSFSQLPSLTCFSRITR